MTLRQKLLALLLLVGGAGILALLLILLLADRQLFDQFLPENRAMRDIESRAKLLVQNYYRYMLTPDLIGVDEVIDATVLIRQRLTDYRGLVAGQPQKEQIAAAIDASLGDLEIAGRDLISARLRFEQDGELQRNLESEIETAFARYEQNLDLDIRRSIASEDWAALKSRYLPEFRMIKTVHILYLQMFLSIRESRMGVETESDAAIRARVDKIKASATLLDVIEENSGKRAWMATHILVINEKMLEVIKRFRLSKRDSEFALSRAEQAGIDLNQAVEIAIADAQTIGWDELRRSLLLSGLILLLTLLISYLLIYAGLDRILRPLEALQVVITRLGHGDFKQRSVDVMRTDEIGQLAAAFNRMAEQLEENVEQKQHFIEQLEQKNVELERFTYTVSHELKSPLVTVKGFVGLLERDLSAGDEARARADMDQISAAIDVMSKQLEDLLELSRAGSHVNQSSDVALNDLCDEVLHMMQGLIDEREAEIQVQPRMPRVYADAARIREVFKNLIENGIKFTPPERHPRIDIDAEPLDAMVLCRVRDHGAGIEPRYHDRVFGLFDRLDPGVPGTGVGLALVKRIVETHGGEIWIDSQGNGQGCCFCFTLPLHRGN